MRPSRRSPWLPLLVLALASSAGACRQVVIVRFDLNGQSVGPVKDVYVLAEDPVKDEVTLGALDETVGYYDIGPGRIKIRTRVCGDTGHPMLMADNYYDQMPGNEVVVNDLSPTFPGIAEADCSRILGRYGAGGHADVDGGVGGAPGTGGAPGIGGYGGGLVGTGGNGTVGVGGSAASDGGVGGTPGTGGAPGTGTGGAPGTAGSDGGMLPDTGTCDDGGTHDGGICAPPAAPPQPRDPVLVSESDPCTSYCNQMMGGGQVLCPGIYDSINQCQQYCSRVQWPADNGIETGDTFACRQTYIGKAMSQPAGSSVRTMSCQTAGFNDKRTFCGDSCDRFCRAWSGICGGDADTCSRTCESQGTAQADCRFKWLMLALNDQRYCASVGFDSTCMLSDCVSP